MRAFVTAAALLGFIQGRYGSLRRRRPDRFTRSTPLDGMPSAERYYLSPARALEAEIRRRHGWKSLDL